MASNDGERRMLFDIRGRRKNVVKVVYAILALLMGLSLLLLAGPGVGGLFSQGVSNNAADQLEEQAVTIERKIRQNPENADLLLSLTRNQISTANALAESNPQTGQIAYTEEARQQLSKASESWTRYLKAADEPSPGGAQVAAQSLFALAQIARTGPEAEANVRAAAQAQEIVAKARPSLGSLSTLAIYRLYSFDYDGADQARKQASPYANTKFERENLDNELEQIEKRAREFEKQLNEIDKAAKEARAKGQPSVANPLSEENPLAQP